MLLKLWEKLMSMFKNWMWITWLLPPTSSMDPRYFVCLTKIIHRVWVAVTSIRIHQLHWCSSMVQSRRVVVVLVFASFTTLPNRHGKCHSGCWYGSCCRVGCIWLLPSSDVCRNQIFKRRWSNMPNWYAIPLPLFMVHSVTSFVISWLNNPQCILVWTPSMILLDIFLIRSRMTFKSSWMNRISFKGVPASCILYKVDGKVATSAGAACHSSADILTISEVYGDVYWLIGRFFKPLIFPSCMLWVPCVSPLVVTRRRRIFEMLLLRLWQLWIDWLQNLLDPWDLFGKNWILQMVCSSLAIDDGDIELVLKKEEKDPYLEE